MTKPTLTIRYARPNDADRLTDFRISQFKTAKEFELINQSILSQQRGYIYLVEENERIISTMQIENSLNKENFINISSSFPPSDFTDFETLYLSKAATIREYRNTGINSYLRKLALLEWIKNESVKSLTGVAYENAPRLRLLENIGYEFTEVQLSVHDFLLPKGKVFFLKLLRKEFEEAYLKLSHETEELATRFNIVNQINNATPKV